MRIFTLLLFPFPKLPLRTKYRIKIRSKTITLAIMENKPTIFKIKLGPSGDVRMHKAVQARLNNPKSTLYDALIAGGFDFPKIDENDKRSKYSLRDSDGAMLGQRKNQLSRRLKKAKNQIEMFTKRQENVKRQALLPVGTNTKSSLKISSQFVSKHDLSTSNMFGTKLALISPIEFVRTLRENYKALDLPSTKLDHDAFHIPMTSRTKDAVSIPTPSAKRNHNLDSFDITTQQKLNEAFDLNAHLHCNANDLIRPTSIDDGTETNSCRSFNYSRNDAIFNVFNTDIHAQSIVKKHCRLPSEILKRSKECLTFCDNISYSRHKNKCLLSHSSTNGLPLKKRKIQHVDDLYTDLKGDERHIGTD